MADTSLDINTHPTQDISVREVFGIDTDMVVKGFADRTSRVPDIDSTYKFDPDTTLAILAGFAYNRRVMIQGYHGTGKVNPYRTGCQPVELACCPRQSR
jgi:cobaltochelatase CobS